jgi:hypothetical protein
MAFRHLFIFSRRTSALRIERPRAASILRRVVLPDHFGSGTARQRQIFVAKRSGISV